MMEPLAVEMSAEDAAAYRGVFDGTPYRVVVDAPDAARMYTFEFIYAASEAEARERGAAMVRLVDEYAAHRGLPPSLLAGYAQADAVDLTVA